MEIIQYLAISLTTISGLLAGTIISFLAKDERKPSEKYFKKIIPKIRTETLQTTLAILFIIASYTNYFFAITSILFIYNTIIGSLLFVEKRTKETILAGTIFIIIVMLKLFFPDA